MSEQDYALMIRKMFGEGDKVRDEGLKTPEDIIRFDDILYDHEDEKMQRLDVYRPKAAERQKLPVIMNIHGGGWVYGSKEVYQYYCMSLAERGFAVVNFSYRLAPEWKYPASFEDVSTVSSWIIENSERYGFDTEHVFALGDSAGAHMLSLYAAALTNPAFVVPWKLPENFALKAIALNCGIYRMKKETLDDSNRTLMKVLLPDRGSEEELYEVSSFYHITSAFPPAFVMTCPGDFLRDCPYDLIPVLQKNNVPFVYRVYGDGKHPLKHVFHCDMHEPAGKTCNDEECAFFREFLDK